MPARTPSHPFPPSWLKYSRKLSLTVTGRRPNVTPSETRSRERFCLANCIFKHSLPPLLLFIYFASFFEQLFALDYSTRFSSKHLVWGRIRRYPNIPCFLSLSLFLSREMKTWKLRYPHERRVNCERWTGERKKRGAKARSAIQSSDVQMNSSTSRT